MGIHTVGIISPGEMGHAIGAVLHQHGMRVITNVQGRSARTVNRAKAAGISDVADDEILVQEADVLLSLLPPNQASGLAERIAAVLHKTGAPLLFVIGRKTKPVSIFQLLITHREYNCDHQRTGLSGVRASCGTSSSSILFSKPMHHKASSIPS